MKVKKTLFAILFLLALIMVSSTTIAKQADNHRQPNIQLKHPSHGVDSAIYFLKHKMNWRASLVRTGFLVNIYCLVEKGLGI